MTIYHLWIRLDGRGWVDWSHGDWEYMEMPIAICAEVWERDGRTWCLTVEEVAT